MPTRCVLHHKEWRNGAHGWNKAKHNKRNHKRMNGNTIYHVSFGDDDNHYFGSIAAIYDHFTPHELGVSASRLWNYGITEQKPYRNNKVIIRRGVIQRKKTNRKNPNSNGWQWIFFCVLLDVRQMRVWHSPKVPCVLDFRKVYPKATQSNIVRKI